MSDNWIHLLEHETIERTRSLRWKPAPLFESGSAASLRDHLPALALIAAAVFLIYAWGIWYPTLGPELALFYSVASGKTFRQVMSEYVNFSSVLWFRPTAFYLPYWIGERFLDWHNIVGWKLFQLAVLIPACWVVYVLTQVFFRGQRLAGVIAALYLAVYPGCLSVVLQSAAFDATHIFFAAGTVILFCLAQAYRGSKAVLLTTLAVVSFIGALTSKELTIVTPLYLACISVVVLLSEKRHTWTRQAMMLLPFFILLPTYYYLRFLRMPVYERSSDYRTLFNPQIVVENATKFPLWVLRLFGGVTDSSSQSLGHVHPLNLLIAVALLLLVVVYWVPVLVRRTDMRYKAGLLLLWIGVFLSVPIYSGRYLWHVDLAVVGYALLVGMAVSGLTGRISSAPARTGIAALAIVAFIGMGVLSSRDNVLRGVFSTAYRVGARLLHNPPLPPSAIGPNALVFIEDRRSLSAWTYGGQALFRYIYLKPDLLERAVPAMDKVSVEARKEWLSKEHAYFFRYDDDFNWYDDSAAFRESSLRMLERK